MPKIVEFDPVRLLIIEIGVQGSPITSPQTLLDNEVDMTEIYSEWKEWVAQTASPSGDLGYPAAIRFIGGDPISDVQNAGVTFFMINGWRLKPAEGNHKWTVVGNVFTDPPGQSVFTPTDGNYQVHTETRVSNLVDSSVARLDLAQLLNSVYIDTDRGVSGTGTISGTQIGTPTLPSNNITDARTIADNFRVRSYNLRGSISLGEAHLDWKFTGDASERSATVNMNNQSVGGSRFINVLMTGAASNSSFDAEGCGVDILTEIAGIFRDCGFVSSFRLATGGVAQFVNCFSEIPYASTPTCDWNGAFEARWADYSGGLEITNMGSASPQGSPLPRCSVDLDPGTFIMGPTNVDGFVKVRGVGEFINNLGSPEGVFVDSSELVKGSDLQTTRKLAQNRTHTDPNTGIMTVFDDDDTSIFLQGDLFEDVAATQPYRGQGAERRDRLT